MAHRSDGRIVMSGEEARQGEIILHRRWQRWVFIAGLVGFVILAVLARFTLW